MNKFSVSKAVPKAVATTGNKFSIKRTDNKPVDTADNWGHITVGNDGYVFVHIKGVYVNDGEFTQKLRNSTKDVLKKKFWLINAEQYENAQKPEDFLTQELLVDLRKAYRVGLNKTYQLIATPQAGNYYLSLVALKPKTFGFSNPQKERKLGDEQIAYIGMNTKNSKVGVITPAKTKRG